MIRSTTGRIRSTSNGSPCRDGAGPRVKRTMPVISAHRDTRRWARPRLGRNGFRCRGRPLRRGRGRCRGRRRRRGWAGPGALAGGAAGGMGGAISGAMAGLVAAAFAGMADEACAQGDQVGSVKRNNIWSSLLRGSPTRGLAGEARQGERGVVTKVIFDCLVESAGRGSVDRTGRRVSAGRPRRSARVGDQPRNHCRESQTPMNSSVGARDHSCGSPARDRGTDDSVLKDRSG